MRRVVALLTALILLLTSHTAFAAASFPAGLTALEAEAFMNDRSLAGVQQLPVGVETIGTDAFSGTGLFALDIPATAISVGSQRLNDAGYVRLRGADTVLASLSGVCCLIAPAANTSAAAITGIDLVCEEQLVEDERFFYQMEGGSLTLLLAKDPAQVGHEVTIPALIDDMPVAALSAYAFMGCSALETINLPAGVKAPESAFSNCPNATVTYYGGEGELTVDSITTETSAGVVGDRIVWHVDVTSGSGVSSYDYTLRREDKTLVTQTSSSSSFSYVLEEVGTYQLTVRVTDKAGNVATGMSAVLFIAHEAMNMTVPETITAGTDLVIQVAEAEGAISYSIVVTDDSTGASVANQALTKPGKINIPGYLLEPGVYRVSGYVYGNDFRYTVPSVATVTINGEQTDGPIIPEQTPLTYNSGSKQLLLSSSGESALRYWYQYSDGSLSTKWITTANGDSLWISPAGSYEQWADGGIIFVQGAIKQNGVWSAWGPVCEVTVTSGMKLDSPVFTAPATVEAGADLTISFDEVKDAFQYELTIWQDYLPNVSVRYGQPLYHLPIQTAGLFTLPGYVLSEGTYTLQLSSWSDGYQAGYYLSRLDVTGQRTAAPTVIPDKTEAYYADDTVTLYITAPGATSAVIQIYRIQDSSYADHMFDYTLTLDENGCGSRQLRLSEGSWVLGHTMEYRVSALMDGRWSDVMTVPVLMVDRVPLEKATVNLPESIAAGQDLSFTFDAVENATSYEVYLYSSYSNGSLKWWSSSNALPGMTLTFPGYNLTHGSYYVLVEATSDTHGTSSVKVPFTVTGTLPSAPAPAVTADLDEVHIKETITFTIDTAGADKVAIKYTSNNGNSSFERTPISDSTTWTFTPPESAKGYLYTFSFSVRKNGVWTAWKTISRTILDIPTLDAPVLHANATFLAGEDIVLSFDAVENAESYHYRFHDVSETSSFWSSTVYEPTSLSISGSDLEPGNYLYTLTASSSAYRDSSATATVEIVGTKPTAPTVTLDKATADMGEYFTFTIDTTDVEALRYRYHYNSTSSTNYSSNGNITVLDNTTKWQTSTISAGRYEYEFSALIDGRWTAWSEIMVITISDSSNSKPIVTAPTRITAGQDLPFTVEQNSNATYHYIGLYNSRGMQLYSSYPSGAGPLSLSIPGYYMTAGNYRLHVTAYGNAGSSTTDHTFTVSSAARPDAPQLITAPDVGHIGNYFTFEVNTAGAQKAAVRYYRDGSTNAVTYNTLDVTGDVTSYRQSHSTADDVLNFSFAVMVDGVWSPWSNTHQVPISSREQLAPVTLTMPDSIEAGQDIALSFTGVTNADSYNLRLYYPNGNYESWTAYPSTPRVLEGHSLTSGTYRVVITANGALYDSSTAEKTFTVIGELLPAPAVTVDRTEVLTSETFTFAIDSTDAEQIRYHYTWNDQGSSSNGTLNVLSNLTIWETSTNSSGMQKYSFCVYKDGKWTAWSTPIAITINARPPLPDVTFIAPTVITHGQNLTVTVTPVEGADFYYVYLFNSKGQSIASRSLYTASAGTVEFYGYQLSTGIFRVRVTASSNTGGSSEANGVVTITAGDLPQSPAVTAPESTTIAPQTRYTFTLSAAGAEKAVVRYYRIGSPNDLYYSVFSTNEDGIASWSDSMYNSGVTYAYSFAMMVDGVWSQWSPFTEITIE